jgi:hypothetical protein
MIYLIFRLIVVVNEGRTDTRLTNAGLINAGLTNEGLTNAGLTNTGLTNAGRTNLLGCSRYEIESTCSYHPPVTPSK